MLRIFTPLKIQRLRPGLNPQTWVPEASMLTTRPPKPSKCEQNFSRKKIPERKIVYFVELRTNGTIILKWFLVYESAD